MRRRCRVNDKALHVRDVRQQREDFQAVDKLVRFLLPALDVEGEDGRAAVREILLIKLVVRAVRQRRMVDLFYLRVVLQVFDYFLRVFHVSFYSQRQCFQSLQQEERIERRKSCSCISQ